MHANKTVRTVQIVALNLSAHGLKSSKLTFVLVQGGGTKCTTCSHEPKTSLESQHRTASMIIL